MKVIGLMSGTSADGIDAALCDISGNPPQLDVQVIASLTEPFTQDMRQRILQACSPELSRVDTICQLNFDLAEAYSQIVLRVVEQAGLQFSDIDLIGAHGQTIWHFVSTDGIVRSTLQIGEASVLSERTGITTVHNFRSRDVAAGGQGAPLTAYVDWLLLRHATQWRAVQNIGGIGNVTFLPPLSDQTSKPLAFDTGPGNVLIDAAVYELSDGELTYDAEGLIAQQGQVDEVWLEQLLQHPYFVRGLPKTTGRELFGTQMAVKLVNDGKARGLSPSDIIMTLTLLTAQSIADAYKRFAPARLHEVILGGGGHRNTVLVEILSSLVSPAQVKAHEDIGLSSDFKEAMVFAVLAHETWHARPATLPVLTGARHPVVLGQITPGQNYIPLSECTWGVL